MIILDGFQKLHWNSVGNLETVLGFLMLHVRWCLMWNVSQHQVEEPSALECDRFFWSALFFFFFLYTWSWRLQVCPWVSYYQPCYMGHICGLQCYDHLGRICAVLTVQKKAVDNFPVEQVSWKADIRSSSQEISSFNGKWTFISELKSACHWGSLWHCTLFFFMIGCQPSIPQVQILLL
jgi:hypothetical protein